MRLRDTNMNKLTEMVMELKGVSWNEACDLVEMTYAEIIMTAEDILRKNLDLGPDCLYYMLH